MAPSALPRPLLVTLLVSCIHTADIGALHAEPLAEAAATLAAPQHGTVTAAAATRDGIYAVGARGLILQQHGGGWRQIPAPTRRMLTSIAQTADDRLLAVGHDALILSTPATAASWKMIRSDTTLDAPLLDVWIGADGQGLAVGAYGLALATADHGRTWLQTDIDPEEPHFYAIREDRHGNLFVVGEFGTVQRSSDRGRTWERLNPGYDGTFFGIRFDTADRILLFGLQGRLYQSGDSGESWRRIEAGVTAALYDATVLDDGRMLLVGAAGTVLLETGPGSETFRAMPLGRRGAITAVLADAPHAAVLFGEDGIHQLQLPPMTEPSHAAAK